jgi:hypothetical protein
MIPTLWSRTWFRVSLWTVTLLSLPFILFYGLMNKYGNRRLAEVRAAYAAAGESLDFYSMLPAAPPDEQNFCAQPLLRGMALVEDKSSDSTLKERRARLAGLALNGDLVKRPRESNPYDLEPTKLLDWAKWLDPKTDAKDNAAAADVVLAHLPAAEAVVNELAVGLDRQHSSWTPAWSERPNYHLIATTPVPFLESVNKLRWPLLLYAAAQIEKGQVAQAVKSLRVLARITEACHREPLIINQLVASLLAGRLAFSVWELTSSGKASMAELDSLLVDLKRLNTLPSWLQAYRCEVASCFYSMLYLADHGVPEHYFSSASETESMKYLLTPSGYYCLNAAEFATLSLDYQLLNFKGISHWQPIVKGAAACRAKIQFLREDKLNEYLYELSHTSAPNIMNGSYNASRTEAYLTMARVACELAKHQLAKGNYPQTLAELGVTVTDPLSGYSLGYRLKGQGYEMWSVGTDFYDDGGKKGSSKVFNPFVTAYHYKGDWLWTVP